MKKFKKLTLSLANSFTCWFVSRMCKLDRSWGVYDGCWFNCSPPLVEAAADEFASAHIGKQSMFKVVVLVQDYRRFSQEQ